MYDGFLELQIKDKTVTQDELNVNSSSSDIWHMMKDDGCRSLKQEYFVNPEHTYVRYETSPHINTLHDIILQLIHLSLELFSWRAEYEPDIVLDYNTAPTSMTDYMNMTE